MKSNNSPRSGSSGPADGSSATSRGRSVVVVLSVSAVSYALVQSMVNPGLEALRGHVHTTQLGVSWVLTAFLLSSAVLTPVLGRLGDQVGKRRILIAVLLLLTAGSLVAALATSLPVLVLGRLLQGAGGATLPLAFGIVRDLLPTARVGTTVGLIAAVSSVGGAIGVLVTGPIIEGLGVPWLFWLPAIANGIMVLAVLLTVPDTGTTAAGGRMNWPAGFLLAAALVLLLLPLSLGQEWGWGSVRTLGLFAAAVVAAAAWVAVETRSRFPLIDMRVFRLRPVWTANLASFLFGVTLYSAFGFIPSFLQTPTGTGYGLGASITAAGLLFLPATAAQFLAGLAAGPLARRVPTKTLLVAGSVPTVAGFLLLAVLHAERLAGGARDRGRERGLRYRPLGALRRRRARRSRRTHRRGDGDERQHPHHRRGRGRRRRRHRPRLPHHHRRLPRRGRLHNGVRPARRGRRGGDSSPACSSRPRRTPAHGPRRGPPTSVRPNSPTGPAPSEPTGPDDAEGADKVDAADRSRRHTFHIPSTNGRTFRCELGGRRCRATGVPPDAMSDGTSCP
ncbi:MFS transporter [Streptomyces andamanensis]|uniref:MFS transporter n=1 Tax=Streptomyces andamanensis TaxID=1565035 RepID=A0ABV8T7D4_9ACTN